MKRLLLATSFLALAGAANAQTIEQWNIDQSVLDIPSIAGFSYPGTGTTAVSFTVPSPARCFKMDPNVNYWTCADSATNAYCGTSHTSATTLSNPWEFNAIARRVKAISGTVPTRLWLEPDAANTTPKGHWYKCF